MTMSASLRLRLLAWLVEHHPETYLKWKGLQRHQLAREPEFLALHARSLREDRCLQTLPERYNLWSLVRRVAALPGACAEVGTYRGGSARFIAAAKGAAPLHLFDTFTGLPAVNPATDGAFRTHESNDTSAALVRATLADHSGIEVHPGVFPDSAAALEPPTLRFKFVHLDVDLYTSTRACLGWFYPRMVPGGIILTHDYQDASVPGVKRAFDEFFADRPEPVVPLWLTQAAVFMP